MNQSEPSLVSLIEGKLASREVELPVFDQIAMQIYQAVNEDNVSVDELCELMQKDLTLTGEVLRVANSSFFSGLSEVATLKDAVIRLGAKQISSIAVMASQKRMYSASEPEIAERLTTLWRHANAAAFGSHWLARKSGHRDRADEAFVAGLMHDVGKTSLLRIIEDLSTPDNGLDLSPEVVDLTIQQLHAKHGSSLLEQWNIPQALRKVVAEQESDSFDQDDVLLAIVRLVDKACAVEGISDRPDDSVDLPTSAEAELLGVNAIALAELQVVLEDAAEAA